MPRRTIMVFHGRTSHTVAGDSGTCAGGAAEAVNDDFMRFGNNQNQAAGPSVWGDFKIIRFRRLSQSAKNPKVPGRAIIRFTRLPLHEYDAVLPGRATRAGPAQAGECLCAAGASDGAACRSSERADRRKITFAGPEGSQA